jgi:hypothetical protein
VRFAGALCGAKDRAKQREDDRRHASAPINASGTLSQERTGDSIFEKTMPSPPNAVTNDAMIVGLSGENPGISCPLRRSPAWPVEAAMLLACPPATSATNALTTAKTTPCRSK